MQPLLTIEEAGIKIVPAVKIGKDESDYRKEQIARLKRDIEEISKQLAAEEQPEAENAIAKQRQLVVNLIAELESNRETVAHPTSGLPGLQCYIPPSAECWNFSRNDLFFLDAGVLKELGDV